MISRKDQYSNQISFYKALLLLFFEKKEKKGTYHGRI